MLSENHLNKLERIVHEYQFEHAMEYFKESIRQVLRLSKKEIETYNETGLSRIGGNPDLPAIVE
ncbi:hypothetical protein DFP94_1011266 [Fontibacillus phaseoli]|uniref:Uncharacterized protein n=1 Tax=Fontibacillus phaseoli TaxID=1416533 RepID=A0A369BVM5_9BACL|nr:hypothetical protein [Fontibacillus phaseoli]RCX23664.1 hypothetical protein DFP94_1011266 [Fontibacillus phaseoli]